jgi:clan AA aspartic protease (TIGR02281 family)
MAPPTCQTHPETPAVASCSHCFASLCEVCRQLDGLQPFCTRCLRRRRRAPFVRAASIALFVAAAGAGAYYAYNVAYKGYEPPYDYGEHAPKIRRLEADLAKEPCDRRKAEELLDAMLDAGDNRGAIHRADAFWVKCGADDELRRYTYQAHQRLGEWDDAVADATVLVEADPYSGYYRAWRGRVYQDKGDLDHAADDFREALLLIPDLVDLPLNLATVYEKQGRPCDAAVPLQQLVLYYPNKPWTAGINARIADLETKGACGVAVSGSGRVTIKMDPGRGRIQTKVRLDGKETASFVVDTGATYVTLTRRLADKMGLSLGAAPRTKLRSANGTHTGLLTTLDEVAVEGLAARRVPAVVVDDLGPGVDGLLGLSFLARFEMRQSNGVVELAPKGAARK